MTSVRPTDAETGTSGILARHRVRDAVQRLILSGELKSGQRLVQQELAGQFGVAQSVVRESLLELQFCGLVRAVDNLGMFVSKLEPEMLLEAYQVREMFEGLAARLCCEQAARTDLRELRELAQHNYRLGRDGKLEEMAALDRQFHHHTVLISRNHLLVQLTEGYRVLGMFIRANRDISQVRDEHLEIVAAIEANRPAQAERLARRHVQAARLAIERQLDQGTFVPQWVVEAEEDLPGRATRSSTAEDSTSRKKNRKGNRSTKH